MKSFHKIRVINPDHPPRGGLGRALEDMIDVLKTYGMNVEMYIPFIRFIGTFIPRSFILIFPTGPGGIFFMFKPRSDRHIAICYHTYLQQSRLVPGEWWKRILVPFERRTLRMASDVFCFSKCTQRVLLEEYGLSTVKLLPQLIDLAYRSKKRNKRQPSHQKKFCLFIGRKDRRKGYRVLLDAWKIVQCKYPDIHLQCVTNGTMTTDTIVDLIRDAELVIAPSYLEGFCLVVAQSMRIGTCVIGSDCDGLRSLIRHKETGWLVPPGDHKALADAIMTLITDDALRKTLSSEAKKDVMQRFDRTNAEKMFIDAISLEAK
jgi:glycosyltransferase involved in cell wall biosynthesis